MNTEEYEISLEHINNKMKIETSINHGLLTIAVFLYVIAIFFLAGTNEEFTTLFAVVATVCTVLAFTLRERTITINVHDGSEIQLHFTRSNKVQVLEFSNAIINAANEYLLNKYGKVDPRLPIEPQLDSIQYLRNRGIISEASYDLLKDQLLGRANKSYIGFGN